MQKKSMNKIIEFLRPFLGLLAIILIFAVLTQGQSVQLSNLRIIAEQSFSLILASAGLFFVMTMGGMDLSIGGTVCICCYMTAKMCQYHLGFGLVLMVATGIFVGFFNGFVNAKLKVPSFLGTLCTSYIIKGLMTQLIASQAVTVPYELYDYDIFSWKLGFTVILLVVSYILYRYHKFGHYVRMIGSNEMAANYSGINVTVIKILAFMICGALGAAAAFLTAIRTGTAALTTGSDMMFNAMIALTLGGFPAVGGAKSRFSAAIIGAYMTYVLNNGLLLLGVTATVQQLIKGAIFLALVIFSSSSTKNFLRSLFKRKAIETV